ncbi:unnamed protein product [Caenorhabditis angaria]|uniref:PCI domain-containing protein n=1 Tax=Caenorhabditis angaria TaxID=860376 RepID=A0A9P1MZM3_9PELO|nr:unnamed protein product [Caenorhabditis angaria]
MAANALTLKFVQNEVSQQDQKSEEASIKRCEDLIISYAKKLAAENDSIGIQTLMTSIKSFYEVLGKARASKLIRELVELCLSIDQGKAEKIKVLTDCIEWATSNHREFLRRNMQARLVRLYNEVGEYTEAQKLAHTLISELKKLEDRELLMEVALEESKSSFYLKNFAKAKCSLVLAKTSANAAYVTPQLQAAIDLQSGILYSAEEKDFKTSYSYFYEAFEGFNQMNDKKNSMKSLKYMILCKIMLNETEQIEGMMATKEFQSVKGKPIEAIRAMADAFKKRCLKSFQEALTKYKEELVGDRVVSVHSISLEENMLQKEISRVVEPYSEIELSFVARKIGMTEPPIERAIAKMILDRKLLGCIDQRSGTVIIYPPATSNRPFIRAMTTIKEITKSVDASYQKANKNLK